jgi:hypothetical protein
MQKGRRHSVWAGAALWAASLALAAVAAPQPGLAQEAPAAEPTAGLGDTDTLPMYLGARNGRAAHDPATLSGVWYAGYDAARGSNYYFIGGTVALNGDISRNGFFLRAYGSRIDYDLHPGDGLGYQADLMVGYRVNLNRVYGGLYIGADYQNFRLDPDDPFAEVRGTEWGFKVSADVATLRQGTPHYFALEGNYSTAFQTYWARARAGLNFPGFTLGPEGVVLGDLEFDAQRVGGFVIFDVPLFSRSNPFEVSVHLGHQFVADSDNGAIAGSVGGGEGTYGGIAFTLAF